MRRILRGFAVPAAGLRLALAVLVAAALPVSAQIEDDSPPPDTGPLARFVPQDNLVLLIEFDGLDQHLDAWTSSAAYKVLNDTSTGAMFTDLIKQAVHVGTAKNTERRVGGDEALGVLEHIIQFGAVLGITGPIDGHAGENHSVIVIREAATKEARPLFGRLLAEAMGPEARPETVDRGSRRIIEYTPADSETRRAWWAEGGHLFLTEAKDVDVILAVLDGNLPNAASHPLRNELATHDGNFEPVGWMFLEVDRLPSGSLPPEASDSIQQLGLNGLNRVDYRWGFEGEATMGVTRIAAPEPRTGGLSLFDQPTFSVNELPPMPADVDSFVVLSLDPLPVYDQITKLVLPEAQGRFEEFEQQVKESVRRDLREQILATIGPRAVVYFPPDPQPTGGALNPLALAANLSVQVPKTAMLIELKNRGEFIRSLDEMMLQANRLLEQHTPTLAALLSGGSAPPAAAPAGGREDDAPRPARFRQISTDPKLYVLQLPPQLGSLVNLNLTVAVGKEHVVLATSTDLVRQALALEGSTEDRWSPTGNLATTFDRLPDSLMMLQVSDPSDTLPEALANLPTAIQTMTDAIAAAEKAREQVLTGGPAPGAPGPGAGPAGYPGGGPGGRRLQSASPGAGAGAGPPPGYGSSSAMMSGGPGGPPGGQQGQAPGSGDPSAPAEFKLDPSNAPDADQVRQLLFPGSMAVSVDAQGVQVVTRAAFPNVVSSSSGITAALLIPAIQSAREAARRASGEDSAEITTPENAGSPGNPGPEAGSSPGNRGAGSGKFDPNDR